MIPIDAYTKVIMNFFSFIFLFFLWFCLGIGSETAKIGPNGTAESIALEPFGVESVIDLSSPISMEFTHLPMVRSNCRYPSGRMIRGVDDEQSAFDAVSTEILDNRTSYVGFSIGYLESGLAMTKLKTFIWPGNSGILNCSAGPKGRKKLRIGVPVKQGFTQFVNIHKDPRTNKNIYGGFCIDVFHAVFDAFKIPYEFVPSINKNGNSGSAGTYDDILYQIYEKKFDGVVGDTTIVANRTSFVDFTLPYLESSRVTMLIPKKYDRHKNIWIILQPFSWDLWLAIIMCCIITGIAIWFLERNTTNAEFRGSVGGQLGMIFWFPFSSIVFPQREIVVNGCSRFLLVVWLLLVVILTQSYTASLFSVLTVDQMQPKLMSIEEIRTKGHYVGYQKGSFVRNLLVNQLKFNESKLKSYDTIDQYHKALSRGTKNNGVDAIFDEIPYIKVFLKKYSSKYMMAGPTYRTNGFGFAFPIGSPLQGCVSRAILYVTETGLLADIEKKYFGSEATSQNQVSRLSSYSPSLTANNFGGLFFLVVIATLLATLLAVVCSENSIWQRLVAITNHHIQNFPCQPSDGNASSVHSTVEMNVMNNSVEIRNLENSTSRISAQSGENASIEAAAAAAAEATAAAAAATAAATAAAAAATAAAAAATAAAAAATAAAAAVARRAAAAAAATATTAGAATATTTGAATPARAEEAAATEEEEVHFAVQYAQSGEKRTSIEAAEAAAEDEEVQSAYSGENASLEAAPEEVQSAQSDAFIEAAEEEIHQFSQNGENASITAAVVADHWSPSLLSNCMSSTLNV